MSARRIRLSASDIFHRSLDRQIRRDGGPGNLGQLHVRGDRAVEIVALRAAWQAAVAEAPILAARIVGGLRGPHWQVPARAEIEVQIVSAPLAELAQRELRAGSSGLIRLAVSTHERSPGVVLTWNHQLCDARGAQGLLAALPRLALGGRLGESWSEPAYRHDLELPRTVAARGRMAQAAMRLLRPLGRHAPLRPGGRTRNAAAPVRVHHQVIEPAITARIDARAQAAVGRFGETPFLLAAVAGALTSGGDSGDLLFPLAVDLRRPGETHLFANRHGFLMLPLSGALARQDLAAAARAMKAAHRTWLAADGITKLLAAISWFPYAGEWFTRYQLGGGRAGLAASCLVANTGKTLLSGSWFGAEVLGLDHVAVPPGQPGVAVLFHRDGRGLCLDVVVTGALGRRLPPARLAESVVQQLVERPFEGAP